MQTKGWVLLRTLLYHFHPHSSESFFKYLAKEDVKEIISQNAPSAEILPFLQPPSELIKKIHYSWLIPCIQKFPETLQVPLIFSLPPTHSSKLRQLLKKPPQRKELSPPIQRFLINILHAEVYPKEILPLYFLPRTALTPLATMSKIELIELIDFLGIYDLTGVIRRTIDTNILRTFYACLDQKKRQFLQVCLHQKEKMSTTLLLLEEWRGECKQLENILHNRGLLRLGKALSAQHPHLVWHIAHILDAGRGTMLSKYAIPDSTTPTAAPLFAQQVVNLMNFLKTKIVP